MNTVKQVDETKSNKSILKFLFVFTSFHALLISQIVSLIGDHINNVGLIWYINEKMGISGGIGFGFAMALPMALMSVFAGVIVDNFKRTSILFMTDIIRMIVVLGMALLFALYNPSIVTISILSVILGISGLLFKPAIQSLLPDIAGGDKDELVRMDAWLLGTITTLMIAGPSIAGFITPYVSIEILLLIDAITFAVSALFLGIMIKKLKVEGNYKNTFVPKRGNPFKQAKDGFSFIFKHKVLGPQFTFFPLMETVMFSVPFLLPVFISEHLNGSPKLFGIFLGVWALGRILGMNIVRKTTLINNRGVVFASNFILQGVAFLIIATSPNALVCGLGFLLLGIPAGAATICVSSYIQTDMPNEMRGRIFAGMTSIVTCLMPLGPIGIGLMSQQFGIEFAFLSISVFMLIFGLIISSYKAVRTAK